jgi:hypothetical protein
LRFACIGVCIRTRDVQQAGTTECGQTVCGSSCGGELSPGRGSAKMISDGRSDANRKVLIKRVGKNQLPTAQASGTWRPGLPVAAPCTGNGHIDLLGHRIPGQALVTEFQDLLCGGGVSRRAVAAQGDAGTPKLMAYSRPGNAQLGTDLAQGPTLCVQVGCTLNIHRATVASLSRIVIGLVNGQLSGSSLVIHQSGQTTRRKHIQKACRAVGLH